MTEYRHLLCHHNELVINLCVILADAFYNIFQLLKNLLGYCLTLWSKWEFNVKQFTTHNNSLYPTDQYPLVTKNKAGWFTYILHKMTWIIVYKNIILELLKCYQRQVPKNIYKIYECHLTRPLTIMKVYLNWNIMLMTFCWVWKWFYKNKTYKSKDPRSKM